MKSLKVLWFSNTPANAYSVLGHSAVGGGWLESLDLAIQDKIDLHVAFYHNSINSSFKYLNTTYYPINVKNWKLLAIRNLFFETVVDDRDLGAYLAIVERVNPDLIHIHGTENSFCCLIGKTGPVPIVISIQGNINGIYHKFLSGFDKEELKSLNFNFSQGILKYLLSRSFFKTWKMFEKMRARELKYLKLATNVIGRTAWDRRVCSILAPESKYFHNDELMRESFYQLVWQRKDYRKFVIHTTTSDSPYKGFETVCLALHELNNLAAFDIEWRIAGLSPDSLIMNLTRRKLGRKFPEKGLVLLGKLPEEKLSVKLLEANLFVSASHIDNSSNSLCEAMLLGMPCIATNVGGTPSLLEDGKEGVLVQDGDPWALAGAILEFRNNPDRAANFGRKARVRALMRHDRERVVSDLTNIYSLVRGD